MQQPVEALSTQLAFSVVFSYLLERVKASKLVPWITQQTPKLNRALAIVVSGAAALGVSLTTVHPGAGTYVITVSGLTLMNVATSGFAWLKSYVVQEIAYQKFIKNGSSQPAKE